MLHSKLMFAVAAVGLSTAASAGGNHGNLRGHYVDANRGGQVQSIRINRYGVTVNCRRDRVCSGSADVRRRDGHFIRAVQRTHRAKTVFKIHRLNDRAIRVNTRIKFRDGRVREFNDRLVRSRRAHHTQNHHTYNSHHTLAAPGHVSYSNHHGHGSFHFNWNPVKHAAHYLLEFACHGHKCGHHKHHRKVYNTNYRYTLPRNGHNYRYRVVAVDRRGRRGHASAWRDGPRRHNRQHRREHRRNHH